MKNPAGTGGYRDRARDMGQGRSLPLCPTSVY
jgi:hypothetical protein